jgi:DNA/RNA endonuclease YhcR with UshA esterase domain
MEVFMRKSLLSLFAAGALLTGIPLAAHHSISAEFDTSKPIEFKGTVKKVDWMNPHIYTHVEVKDGQGKITVWKVEGGPPNALFRQGFREDSLKVGEVVSVKGIRAKAATSNNIGSATITKEDGSTVYGR